MDPLLVDDFCLELTLYFGLFKGFYHDDCFQGYKTKKPPKFRRLFMWYPQELNQGHQDFQSCALPTELGYH